MNGADHEAERSIVDIEDILVSMEVMIRIHKESKASNDEDITRCQSYLNELNKLFKGGFKVRSIENYIYDFMSISYMLGVFTGKSVNSKNTIEDLEKRRTEPARRARKASRVAYEEIVIRCIDIYQSNPRNKRKKSADAIAAAIWESVKFERDKMVTDGSVKDPKEVTERSVRDTIRKIRNASVRRLCHKCIARL